MKRTKRPPKTNFKINGNAILDSKLSQTQGQLLKFVLDYHLANCKYKYENILNGRIQDGLDISEPTLIRNRKALEEAKLFEIKRIRNGKSTMLEYRFNWAKLSKLKFILPIEQNEFSPKKRKTILFKEGELLTLDNSNKFNDEKYYEVVRYSLDRQGKEMGIGLTQTMLGKSLKTALKIEHNREVKEQSYKFKSMK